jgi:hypothetical protein
MSITPKEFRLWQASVERYGRQIKGVELAGLFGVVPETVSRWRAFGVGDQEERRMRLAMAALTADIKPWGEK